jgi:type I restriction enzyme R subunit
MIKEFNAFSEGSVDSSNNTKKLVEQFADDTPLSGRSSIRSFSTSSTPRRSYAVRKSINLRVEPVRRAVR